MTVRVRFAPSPTGSLHLGSALTAVANWLFARQQGGELVLRIDDTDEEREVEGAERAIEQDLRWLGLGWDEGPVRQSERRQRHLEQAAAAEGAHTRDGAVWLSSPGLSEFVIVRSDGRPTYRWASAVDDADMGITHVIRGNDHLPNAALQIAAVRCARGRAAAVPAPRAGARRGWQAVEARRRRLDRGAARGGLPAGGDREPAGAGGQLRAGGRDVAAGAGRAVRHRPAGARRGGAREQAAAGALDRAHLAVGGGRPGGAGARVRAGRHRSAAGGGDGAGAARRPHAGRGRRPGGVRDRGAAAAFVA